MSSNKQRRESERLRLQRQLEERRQREAARKRTTAIVSVVGALVLVAAIVVIVIVASSGSDDKKKIAAGSSPSATPTPSTAAACGQQTFPTVKAVAATGPAVTFDGVTVKGAADLKGKPGVTAKGTTTPTKLAYKDLVVGKGAVASPTSCVTVQYDGVLYKTGAEFDSSWSRGMLAQFSLTKVVAGFTQGIGGTTGVPPMRVGGRRLMILPSALGYGTKGSPPTIPANAPLVFVVDLTAVSSAS